MYSPHRPNAIQQHIATTETYIRWPFGIVGLLFVIFGTLMIWRIAGLIVILGAIGVSDRVANIIGWTVYGCLLIWGLSLILVR